MMQCYVCASPLLHPRCQHHMISTTHSATAVHLARRDAHSSVIPLPPVTRPLLGTFGMTEAASIHKHVIMLQSEHLDLNNSDSDGVYANLNVTAYVLISKGLCMYSALCDGVCTDLKLAVSTDLEVTVSICNDLKVAGVAILGVGIWIKVDPNISRYLDVIRIDQNVPIIEAAIITLITVGALMLVIGFLGCCGACRESSCMLCLYSGLLVVVILGQVAAVVMGLLFRKELGVELKLSMEEQARYNVTNEVKTTDILTLAWNLMQTNMKCCGGSDFTDYKGSLHFGPTDPVPLTCCVLRVSDAEDPIPVNKDACFREATSGKAEEFLNKDGCYSALNREMNKKSLILISVAGAIAAVQIFGTLFACCVRSEIKKNDVTY
ncbi:hypothetical protein NP493_760g01037 [Ridgeia piscesae]|uniref:Tetraspanin n=1 Tax=Ridgeia piscesae TaxID=27915 RepID=A0AAD9NM38_RIDPI|nr:hypothetical protein NP493_760g01037 [Ridgeia piscesae]